MQVNKITDEIELKKAFQLREDIFVKEQGVPLEDEFDEYDELGASAEHVIAYYHHEPAGTGRIRYVDGVGKLERICILKSYRSLGIGKLIIDSLEKIAQTKNVLQTKLHGQVHAEGFYHQLGYETASEVFMEDGIPHILMLKNLANDKLLS